MKATQPSLYYSDTVSYGSTDATDVNCARSTKCWNCTYQLPKAFVSIPYETTPTHEFRMFGAFCSLACAKRYVIENWVHQASTRMMWLNAVARSKYNIPHPEIVPAAPPRQSLRIFGGPLTARGYQQRVKQSRPTALLYKPFLTFPMKLLDETQSIRVAAEDLACLSLFETHTAGLREQKPPPPVVKQQPAKPTPPPEPPVPTPPPPPSRAAPPSVPAAPAITNTTRNTLYNYVIKHSS